MSESEQIEQYIDRICQKFHYDSELTSFLHSAIPSLISHYGIENKERIFETFENCEIHIQQENEEPSIFISEYFKEELSEEEKEHVDGFFKTAFHIDRPIFVGENVTLQDMIYVKNNKHRKFDWSDENSQSTLIHEMCHAIKTYGHIKVNGDNVITSSGLIKSIFQYNTETGNFDLISSYGEDLEEALNTLDECAVMSIMKKRPSISKNGYISMLPMAKKMMSFADIADVVRTSQLSGSDEWIEYMGKENCAFIVENFSLSGVRLGRNGKLLRQQMREAPIAREKLNEFFDNYKPNKDKIDDNEEDIIYYFEERPPFTKNDTNVKEYIEIKKEQGIDFTEWSLEDIERYKQTGELPQPTPQIIENEHSNSL